MGKAQILVVEDEKIIARDIQKRLKKFGYAVPAVVSFGEEAIEKAGEMHPDLVLMDIVLQGDMDGVEAARQIRVRFDIPVVYLTAYSDEKTLEGARTTEPYGYILKPFEDRELLSTVEMALYRHKVDRKLRESEHWFATTLKSIGDAVITADKKGYVKFMNPLAESLTGWKQEEAVGKPLKDVFNILDEETGKQDKPETRVIRKDAVVGLENHKVLIARDGTKRHIDERIAPIRDDKGDTIGKVLVLRDITERKRAEKALHESEEKYRTLYESSKDGISLCGIQGNFFDANQAYLDMLGYTMEELKTLTYHQITAKKYHEMEADIVKNQVLARGYSDEYEKEYIRKDGTIFPITIRIWLIKDEKGKPTGTWAIVRDTTEHRRAEEALRESEKRYRDLYENAPNAYFSISAVDGSVLGCNSAALQLLGYDKKIITKMNVLDLYADTPHGISKAREILKHFQAGESIQDTELQMKRKDGQPIWISLTFEPLKDEDGNVVESRSMVINISERKRAEEALRGSEEKYRTLYESSKDGISLCDIQGNFFDANQAYLDMLGYTREEIKKLTYQQITPKKWHEMEADIVKNQVMARGYSEEFGKEYIKKDGTVFPITIRTWLINDEQGKPKAMWAIVRDLTERKRAEEEVRRKNEELENFVYSVSHDLKSPLITLQGFISALEEDCGERLDKKARGHLGFIRDATKKMEVLIKDLLEFSRIGRIMHPKEDVDFSQIVEESLKVLGTGIEQEGIELVVADELPVVRCERQRMVQVMENLLSNAVKFMGDNPSPRIEVGHREEDGFHRFWVKDNGIGIDPRDHGEIFEIFRTLREVEDADGTGMGLTIAKKVIEQHGGRIWVGSAKGQGSTFYFTLPRN